jgi:two-component system, OmpR family, sensor kinase
MPERVWYKSLYWRIALGYVALLAVLMLVQTGLSVWVMDRMWGGSNRTAEQLAELVAQDLSARLAQSPQFDVEQHLRAQYGSGYQPFVVLLRGDARTLSNRPNAIPMNLGKERGRLMGRPPGDWGRGGPPDPGRFGGPDPGRGGGGGGGPDGRRGGPQAQIGYITVNEERMGIVAVPSSLPPLSVGLREAAPTLISVGIALLGLGAAVMALVIFRPSHQRLRSLEDAARALGEGRTDVRANESGGDEVSALSTTFNRMAADLQARATALAESDRARRQLLADVSHELMTPLSAIRGYVETLSMPELTLDAKTQHRYLDITHQETHKLEAIIGDLLDLARLEGGGDTIEPEEVLADDLFRRVRDRHRLVLRDRKITLTSTTAPDTPHIWGDADRLEQALQNLAANAIRHTPDGGEVTLMAQPDGDRVRMTVADTGPGIPAEHLPHIFDRFYKADASRAGTTVPSGSGLGLSIVRAIVVRHGGDVHASNAPSRGAVFTLVLPAADRSGRDGPDAGNDRA